MISELIAAGITLLVTAVPGVAYVVRLEGKIGKLEERVDGHDELVKVQLANIDKRLERIEKKVLNGGH